MKDLDPEQQEAVKDEEPSKEGETEKEEEGQEQEKAETPEPAKPPPPEKQHFTLLPTRKPSSVESDGEGSHVHVVARVRPLNPQETARKDTEAVEFTGDGGVMVDSQTGMRKSFTYNAVFETDCTQVEVFENCEIRKLLDMALDGYACTAFAFGQTGSGKTYTMTGPVTPETNKQEDPNSLRHPDNYGLIQYSFAYLMNAANKKPQETYTIRASYMEIYNEQVQDLLNPYGYDIVQVRWSKATGFYVENLFVREIEGLDQLMDVLEDGMKNRSVAEHNMNEHSSRSHSILTVHLESETTENQGISVTKRGKISFVDLAGSEKVKDTGSTGDTLTEATNINRSLLTLGNCISALSDSKKRTGHIPFRDSKLTKLLADSLGGSGATLMIACVSPSSQNVTETLNTLRYAKRAKKIKNKPVVRMDPREELIIKLQREMNLIKHENVFLRNQLEFPQREKPRFPQPNAEGAEVLQALPELKQIPGKVAERPATENTNLYGMLQEYMVENEALRNQNQSLMTQHSNDEREFRIISRENDRLTEKLEDLQRLVLSSPMISNGYSRTNSGHSYLSLQSYDSSLTPISQTFQQGHYHPVFGPNGTSYPNFAANHALRHPHQRKVPVQYGPMQHPFQAIPAWNNTPEGNRELPPLKRSPPAERRQVNGYGRHPNPNIRDNHQSKWEKARSYAKQIQLKKDWYRVPNPHGNHDATKKPKRNDVMSDFPLRDLTQQRQQEQLHGQHHRHHSQNRQLFPNNQPVNPAIMTHADPLLRHPHHQRHNTHVLSEDQRFQRGDGLHGAPTRDIHPPGGALPQEAYRAVELSPRGQMTKELSATSLRRMNNKMKQEMRALDAQIHYETKIHKTIPS